MRGCLQIVNFGTELEHTARSPTYRGVFSFDTFDSGTRHLVFATVMSSPPSPLYAVLLVV